MIELYVLLAVMGNIIADLLIWGEVKRMRCSHTRIESTVHTIHEGFSGFSESLGVGLTDHAKLVAKSVTSAIGYYQGKAQKATEGEIEGLQETLGALAPIVQLMGSQNSGGKSPPGYHI